MPVSDADAKFVRDLVLRRAAIQLDQDKQYLIDLRLAQVARDSGLADVAELVGRARNGVPGIEVKIIEAITTHETSFFRDLSPFESLKSEVLPRLLGPREKSRSLTIWCAACSTGQEPYSIAMLLRENYPQLARWITRIVATDISAQILTKAREARFTQLEVNRGLPAALLVKHFTKVGASWLLNQEIKDLVEFRQLNLIESWNLTPAPDIVFLRNVLIYFDVPTKRRILERVRNCIAPDGVLFLGAAESTLNIDEQWDRVAGTKAVYYTRRS